MIVSIVGASFNSSKPKQNMKLTKAQKQKLIKEFERISTHRVVFGENYKDRTGLDRWAKDGRPVNFSYGITDGEAIGLMDTSYGYLALYDTKEWVFSTQSVATDLYCFLGDYYGYPDGKLYVAVKMEKI
jgi:hypothetical protein